jgi:dTDP-glucose pyrophosphorylase
MQEKQKARLPLTLIEDQRTCQEGLTRLEKNSLKTLLVHDKDGIYLGLVTDGDVRRAFLRGVSLQDPVTQMMNRNALTVDEKATRDEVMELIINRVIEQVPVIDSATSRPSGLWIKSDFFINRHDDIPVLIMAGGKGLRLGELTRNTPKPMLKLGDRPILEVVIRHFKSHGFSNFWISTQYLAEVIRDYFGDGSSLGVRIGYFHEHKPLGTAGALSFLKEHDFEDCIVTNGDVVCSIDLDSLLKFHKETNSAITMSVKERPMRIPYGVVEFNPHGDFERIIEKPSYRYFVNSGIYVCSREAVRVVPQDTTLDMPQLIERVKAEGKKVSCFLLLEDWIDIGLPEEYSKANEQRESFSQYPTPSDDEPPKRGWEI